MTTPHHWDCICAACQDGKEAVREDERAKLRDQFDALTMRALTAEQAHANVSHSFRVACAEAVVNGEQKARLRELLRQSLVALETIAFCDVCQCLTICDPARCKDCHSDDDLPDFDVMPLIEALRAATRSEPG